MTVRSAGNAAGGGAVWLWYLLAGTLTVAVYYLVSEDGVGPVVRVGLYLLISASAAVAVFFGIVRGHPRPALPWLLIGASQVAYACADATFYINHYLRGETEYPSVSDALYLAHYPLVMTGIVLLIRRRRHGRDTPGLLDASVLAVVAAMLSWLYLISPQAQLDLPVLVKATSLAYPVMDLALLGVSVRLIFGGGRRPPAFFLLAGCLLAVMTADTVYVLQQLDGTYVIGNPLDAIWLLGNLSLGAAALHPSMSTLGERVEVQHVTLGPARIAALCVAALIAPATLFIQDLRGELREVPVIAAACGLLFILTIARLAGLVADQRRLANTDALTGLHTRRYLEVRLPMEVARARRSGGGLGVFIIDVDRFKSVNDQYGHPGGDRALIEIASRLRAGARRGDLLARYGGEEFALVVPDARPDELGAIAERMRCQVASSPIPVSAEAWIGVTVSVGAAGYPLHGESSTALVETADRALYAAKTSGRNRIVVGRAAAMNTAVPSMRSSPCDDGHVIAHLREVADRIDADLSCSEHSQAISRWSALLCAELGAGPDAVRCAELAGRLHDIGKIVIPRRTLTKPGRLSAEEWQLMRAHPDHGRRLAQTVAGLTDVAEVIGQHHEHFDGRGYPAGLAGTAIRLEARVIAVCDSWAAMRADRVYRAPLSVVDAVRELRNGRGTQFDPDVVDAFLALHTQRLVGTLEPLTAPAAHRA